MEYKCKECNKIYSGYQSLWIHNKKFHTTGNNLLTTSNNLLTTGNNSLTTSNNSIIISNLSKKYKCKYCNKSYNIQQSRWKHEQSCINKSSILEENNKLKEENNKVKQELALIKNNQIVPLNNHSHNKTNNNTKNINNINNGTSNINNGTSNINNTVNNNNNTVTINKIGSEPIVFKTKDIKMIANDGLNGPITCARRLNFDKDKPENHSYCVTSLEGEYCTAINHETQQPEKVPKKEIIDQVFESAYNFIEIIATQIKEDNSLRDKLTNHEIKEIDRIVANKNKYYEKKNRKTFYNSINSMSYNYKDLVLSTWKLLKPLEENLISDMNSESDDEIKKVTEFPEDDGPSDSDEEVYCIKRDNNNDTDSDDGITLLDLMKN